MSRSVQKLGHHITQCTVGDCDSTLVPVINDFLDLCLFATGKLKVGKVLGQAVCESLYRHNRVLTDQIPAAGGVLRSEDSVIYCL